ncbi:hypothetical protein GNZ12_06645 [Paraburkholderia sp. 1N]|uniref:GIY-YIG domain-containing protein n=1 Tax=Paraburkholderia solitsugae TaxID=2675748 RepID=A0ABX2BJQ7_9BURK|nr:GIY-YIG nuclease family protein [Paraburkholderia solitsugae]NPT41001.1 hypothetical protein [Paraburkholderia solitsugae]
MFRTVITNHATLGFGIRWAEYTTEIARVVELPRRPASMHEFNYQMKRMSARAGVYILVGHDVAGHPHAYIGQGEDISHRLESHDTIKPKDDWHTAFVCITHNDFMDTERVFLERLFINEVTAAARAKVLNSQTRPIQTYPAERVAECDHILAQFKALLPVVGCNVF